MTDELLRGEALHETPTDVVGTHTEGNGQCDEGVVLVDGQGKTGLVDYPSAPCGTPPIVLGTHPTEHEDEDVDYVVLDDKRCKLPHQRAEMYLPHQ